MPTHYLVCSNKSEVTLPLTTYKGIPCNCARTHYFYALPLEPTVVQSYPDWETGPKGGRRVRGDVFVSNSCALPGTAIRLRLEDGPRPLSAVLTEWILNSARGPAPQVAPFGADFRTAIAGQLLELAKKARSTPALRTVYRALMDTLLWVWTADGYDPCDDRIQRDALKYSFAHLRHTAAAHAAARSELVHEHAVPRKVILDALEGDDTLSVSRLLLLLQRHCFGVVVTKTEDAEHLGGRWRSAMPDTWSFTERGEPLARYNELATFVAADCPTCLSEAREAS